MRQSATTAGLNGFHLAACLGFVVEVRPEPAFDALEVHLLSQMIIERLVAANFPDGKVFRVLVRKVQPAHTRPGSHGAAFGQFDADAGLDIE